jgi:hypothetical protein
VSISFEQIKAEAAKLTPAQRAELADELLRSLDPPADDDATPEEIERAWILEAKRRSDEVARGEVEMLDGEESMARIRQMLR